MPAANDSKDISFKGEVLRKLTHIGALSIPIIYYFAGRRVILILLAAAICVAFTVDMIRFFGREKGKDLVHRLFGVMIRPHERLDFTGATYILTASILTILIFDKAIAVLAIAYIVVGDTASAIVGRLWGRVKFNGKTLEGSLSFFFSCCIAALLVPGIAMWVKLIGALSASVVEALTFYIDDNVTVPLISAAVMQLLLI